MKPCGVLLATAHVPPFLQGRPLQPSNTLSQRWPGEQEKKKPQFSICAPFCTVARCYVAVPTCVTSAAFTSVAVGELNAVVGPSGVTGVRQTLVDVSLAAFTYVAGQAHALVTSDAVQAFAIVEALGLVCQWVSEGGAIIQINLTVDTFNNAGRETIFESLMPSMFANYVFVGLCRDLPCVPLGQEHLYVLIRSMQVPPF